MTSIKIYEWTWEKLSIQISKSQQRQGGVTGIGVKKVNIFHRLQYN